jgi:excisionase family DNA binding protein
MAENPRDIHESPAYKELKALLMKMPVERREALTEALHGFATEERKRQFTSPPEIAARLGVTPATVRRWIREGRIQAKKVGARKWLVPVSEMERLLSMEGQP